MERRPPCDEPTSHRSANTRCRHRAAGSTASAVHPPVAAIMPTWLTTWSAVPDISIPGWYGTTLPGPLLLAEGPTVAPANR